MIFDIYEVNLTLRSASKNCVCGPAAVDLKNCTCFLLSQVAHDFTMTNFDAVSEREEFRELDHSDVVELLSSNQLHVSSEETVSFWCDLLYRVLFMPDRCCFRYSGPLSRGYLTRATGQITSRRWWNACGCRCCRNHSSVACLRVTTLYWLSIECRQSCVTCYRWATEDSGFSILRSSNGFIPGSDFLI